MIEASEFKRGQCIWFKGEPSTIVDVAFTTPTARGASPIAKTKLRNLKSGKLLTESIRVSEKFAEVELDQHPCSYMYSDGRVWHFMDETTYEEFELDADALGEMTGYLKEGLEGMRALLIDGRVAGLVLPLTVELKVVETDPAVRGATATAQMKPATLETGLRILVPPYLKTGESVRVDTRDGHFIERAKI